MLAHVVDVDAEVVAVAEVVLDDVGPVVDGHQDLAEAGLARPGRGRSRAAACRRSRPGASAWATSSVSGRRRWPSPPAMITTGESEPCSTRSRRKARSTTPAVGVEQRDLLDLVLGHEPQQPLGGVSAGAVVGSRWRICVEQVVELQPAQHRAAHVAVGDRAEQPPVGVDDERDLDRPGVDARDRLAHRRAGTAAGVWGTGLGSTARSRSRGPGTPTTVAPRARRATTTAPAPTTRPLADPAPLEHGGAQPDVRACADVHAAAQPRAGRDVDVVLEHAVVLDDRAGVDDHVRADPRARADDRAGQDDGTRAERGRVGDGGAGVTTGGSSNPRRTSRS